MDESSDEPSYGACQPMATTSNSSWKAFSAPSRPVQRAFHQSNASHTHSFASETAMGQRRGACSPLSTTSSSSIASSAQDARRRHDASAYLDLGTDDELEQLSSKRAKRQPSPSRTPLRSRSTDPDWNDHDLLGLGFERLIKAMSVPPGVMARHPSAASLDEDGMQDDADEPEFDLSLDRFSIPEHAMPELSGLNHPRPRHGNWSTEPARSPRPFDYSELTEFRDLSP
eukprot:TRINITY_DN7504_c0_g2_i2.p1 TRINITY_DN7504_c0_g2~~TRINITY_DN7504_c0_g2_i2.p1  ORF type:complete len:228 (+),score=29.31 TRINITY_DN7504_c0_g2_i2:165-848(+)